MNVLTSLICAVLLAGAAIFESDATRYTTSMTLSGIAVLILIWSLVRSRSP